jgi:hypothetical protein
MWQIKEWALLNGGAPSVILVGVALLTQSTVAGLAVLGIGILWFVSWIDPVRRTLIQFLEYPDRRERAHESAIPGVPGGGTYPPGTRFETIIRAPKEEAEEGEGKG